MKRKSICGMKDDQSQYFLYEIPGFSVYLKKNKFPEDRPFCVTDHWHDEIEFVYVTSGSVQYMVEGKNMVLRENQGLFINSRKLHVASPNKETPCEFYCAILHPMLLCSSKYVDQNYVEPIIKNDSIRYLLFDNTESNTTVSSGVSEKNGVADREKSQKALELIERMHRMVEEGKQELLIQSLFFELWKIVFDSISTYEKPTVKPSHHLSTLKEMISYIQQNYKDVITLDDISSSGNVGKTMCTSLFNTYVNKTPIEFLRDYRIQQSIVLLTTTDLSVTDICYETGFSSASYYSECFRKATGFTPLKYRQHHSDLPLSHYHRKRRIDA